MPAKVIKFCPETAIIKEKSPKKDTHAVKIQGTPYQTILFTNKGLRGNDSVSSTGKEGRDAFSVSPSAGSGMGPVIRELKKAVTDLLADMDRLRVTLADRRTSPQDSQEEYENIRVPQRLTEPPVTVKQGGEFNRTEVTSYRDGVHTVPVEEMDGGAVRGEVVVVLKLAADVTKGENVEEALIYGARQETRGAVLPGAGSNEGFPKGFVEDLVREARKAATATSPGADTQPTDTPGANKAVLFGGTTYTVHFVYWITTTQAVEAGSLNEKPDAPGLFQETGETSISSSILFKVKEAPLLLTYSPKSVTSDLPRMGVGKSQPPIPGKVYELSVISVKAMDAFPAEGLTERSFSDADILKDIYSPVGGDGSAALRDAEPSDKGAPGAGMVVLFRGTMKDTPIVTDGLEGNLRPVKAEGSQPAETGLEVPRQTAEGALLGGKEKQVEPGAVGMDGPAQQWKDVPWLSGVKEGHGPVFQTSAPLPGKEDQSSAIPSGSPPSPEANQSDQLINMGGERAPAGVPVPRTDPLSQESRSVPADKNVEPAGQPSASSIFADNMSIDEPIAKFIERLNMLLETKEVPEDTPSGDTQPDLSENGKAAGSNNRVSAQGSVAHTLLGKLFNTPGVDEKAGAIGVSRGENGLLRLDRTALESQSASGREQILGKVSDFGNALADRINYFANPYAGLYMDDKNVVHLKATRKNGKTSLSEEDLKKEQIKLESRLKEIQLLSKGSAKLVEWLKGKDERENEPALEAPTMETTFQELTYPGTSRGVSEDGE